MIMMIIDNYRNYDLPLGINLNLNLLGALKRRFGLSIHFEDSSFHAFDEVLANFLPVISMLEETHLKCL